MQKRWISLFLITFLFLEIGLYLSERVFHIHSFDVPRRWMGESFFGWHSLHDSNALQGPFCPTLGWRNRIGPSDGFRKYSPKKNAKRRIAFLGDSFVYGWKMNDNETLPAQLEKVLGPEVEVLNFGVSGFGLDQMAILATEILPQYNVDEILIGFIAADLERSCYDFNFNMQKPIFVKEDLTLKIENFPVPNREAFHLKHRKPLIRTVDFISSSLQRSRLFLLFAEAVTYPFYRKCQRSLNVDIMEWVVANIPDKKITFIHLDGKLPSGFERTIPKELRYFSIADKLEGLERHEDGHPKPSMNQVMANLIMNRL